MAEEDLSLFTEWNNDPEFSGEHEPFEQLSLAEVEKWYERLHSDERWFLIETKTGMKVGQIMYVPRGPHFRIGYRMVPLERRKGYCTEAVKILVDHLFLSRNIVRIESGANPENVASLRVLEKAGFRKEGVVRKCVFVRGRWLDEVQYNILRKAWKGPRVLKSESSQRAHTSDC